MSFAAKVRNMQETLFELLNKFVIIKLTWNKIIIIK